MIIRSRTLLSISRRLLCAVLFIFKYNIYYKESDNYRKFETIEKYVREHESSEVHYSEILII